MDSVVEKIDRLFEETFAIFSLGMENQSSALHFILLLINTSIPLIVLINFLLEGNLFVSFDALSKFTDLVELFGPIFVHIINLLIFFRYRKTFSELQALRAKLNDCLRKCGDEELYLRVEREKVSFFLLKFLLIEAVGIGIEAFQLVSLRRTDPIWMSSIRTRVISLNMARLMIIQFIYFCDFASSRMRILNSLRMSILTNGDSCEANVRRNLKKVKTLDLDITRLIQLGREYFKWMLLLNITLDVTCIIIDIYWIYGGFIFANNPNFAQSCCCPWSKVVNIVLLFYSCAVMQQQRDNALSEVFEWKADYNANASSKRRLLLQHFHTSKIVLDANGFFYINYGALIGIFEAITIYMVYFFQFMSESNIFILAIERIEGEKLSASLGEAII